MLTSQEQSSQETTTTRLFHILAEGRYHPEYWLHFEVPASASLWLVDDFLKDMWIEDLDHLSGFTINGTDYSAEYPDDFFSETEKKEPEEISEEEKDQDTKAAIEEILTKFAPGTAFSFGKPFSPDPLLTEWIAAIKKPRSLDELVGFLKGELASLTKEASTARKHDQDLPLEERHQRYQIRYYQKMIVQALLEMVEDRSMEVPLQRILKVGQKFCYLYDYGSSTHINLRVLGEREGNVHNEKEPVQLLAQNTALTFFCIICKKPATVVEMSYFISSIEESVYCTQCAKKHIKEGSMLPLINSPRVGVL
jgi:hypothetical protein